MSSLLLTNCHIVSSVNTFSGNILIEGETIKAILELSDQPHADQVLDLTGLHVLPGIIDTHVHFREPGAAHKEDWTTGSRAAVAGGVTTVIDMPNTNPPTTTRERLEEKRRIASEKSTVNFGFFFGVSDVLPLKGGDERGGHGLHNIAGVKIYLDATTGDYQIANEQALTKIFATKNRFALHAESKTFTNSIKLIEPTGNPAHLCHANTATHLETARQYKKKGYPLTVEVCPHHLFLSVTDLKVLKGFGMMKPPLASPKDQHALWEGIADGTIDTIATDHAPHTREEKESFDPPFGVPGLETALPLMLNAANQKRITLTKIVELMCKNPAKIFSIKNKGQIKKGYNADLTVIDLNLEKEVKNENLFTKCGWSPFSGTKLKGWPVMTFVNGTLVFDHGKMVNDRQRGREVQFEEFSPPEKGEEKS